MRRIAIDPNARSFTRGDAPFFYLADTLWMAFSKLNASEWDEILQLRRLQRFNVLQISALPIAHDNSDDGCALAPFQMSKSGEIDFDAINHAYFDHACRMLDMAVDRGFVPCIHLLWANYVPDTWACKLAPQCEMPFEAMRRYVEYAVKRFLPYGPIYSISGDTAFETRRVTDYYLAAMQIVRRIDPGALITLHLQPHADVPDALCDSGMLDFYSYQAGHGGGEDQKNNYAFAEHYRHKPGNKPVVNTEPPYDGHGHGSAYGRFHDFELRKAYWQSLLSGAHAGITYGAHGLWSMHVRGQRFNNVPFSGQPCDWRTALRFDGAWEASYVRAMAERLGLHDIEPIEGVLNPIPEIRLAATKDRDRLVMYIPYGVDVRLGFSLDGYDVQLHELINRRWMAADVVMDRGESTLLMPECNADLLMVAIRK